MTGLLLSLTIVAFLPSGVDPAADPDAVQVFACDFEASDNVNAEGTAAGWSRRSDAQFPHYLPIRLSGAAASGHTCLRIELDGGAAELHSPRVQLENRYAYFIEAQVRTDGLQHDAAFISVVMLGPDGRKFREKRSKTVGGTSPWTRVQIGPLSAGEARWAVLGLHLKSCAADPFAEFDLRGSACFDSLKMFRVPVVELQTPDPLHLYSVGQDVAVSCLVHGAEHEPKFELTLEDLRQPKATQPRKIVARPGSQQAESWSWTWQERFQRPGYYRLMVSRLSGDRPIESRTVPLAVIEDLPSSSGGAFGWSLAGLDDSDLSPRRLRLLEQARIGWIKVPLWLSSNDAAGHRRAMELIEALRRRQIAVIGVLADPPGIAASAAPDAAELFASLDQRQSQALTATLARYGLQVRAWQIGRDGDVSFSHAANPAAAWNPVAQRVQSVVGGAELGTAWPAVAPSKSQANPPWPLVCLTREAGESDRELTERLKSVGTHAAALMCDVGRSTSSKPTLEDAVNLIHRMLAAKAGGARFIGFENPLDPAGGMIDQQGAVQPRLLAWRTAAWAMGPGRHAGQFVLPGGSHCEVFLEDTRAVLVVFNDQPTLERIYLGPEAEIVDALGWRTRVPIQDGKQAIEVDQVPRFVSGSDPEIARWRIASRLEYPRYPIQFGLKRPNELRVTNTLGQFAAGQVTIVPPQGWKVDPQRIEFKIAADDELRLPFELFIPLAGTTGSHLFRFDFDVQAGARRKFEVYHHVRVEDEHLHLEVRAAINAAGQLEVTQRCENTSSDPVTLRCNLFAPGERRLRWQVSNLVGGSDVHVYRLEDGERFRGQTLWVRAEEVGGSRVLSSRFIVGGSEPTTSKPQPRTPPRTARAVW